MQTVEKQDNNTKDWELIVWDERANGFLRLTTLTVVKNQSGEVTFFKNGIILQIQINDLTENLNIPKNLCQIKYLKWKGKEGKEKQNVGKWKVYWKNRKQQIGGFYDNQGRKQGLWKEIYENYWDYAKVIYVGIYYNGIQRDRWDTVFNNNIIGGGCYDNNGQKTGKWVELHQRFFQYNYAYCDAIYAGEYFKGRKQGYWQTFFQNKIIGGGLYNEGGQKNGNWIELSDCFQSLNQVIYKGKYKNGLPIETWKILINYYQRQIHIGGGAFDENGKKNGRWVDLCLNWLIDKKEISYIGEYKNGRKTGQWNISNLYNRSIGGGQFKEGVKNGQWIEVHENWDKKWPQITYNGCYLNGKKNGRWDTYDNYNRIQKFIGGGQFQGGIKNGNWIDVHDSWRPNWRQITYHGEYQMGKKFGLWKILEEDRQIGGGAFNENGMKNGKWVDVEEKWHKEKLEVCL